MDTGEAKRDFSAILNHYGWQNGLQSAGPTERRRIFNERASEIAGCYRAHLQRWETLTRALYDSQYSGGLVHNLLGQRAVRPVRLFRQSHPQYGEGVVVAEISTREDPGEPTNYNVNFWFESPGVLLAAPSDTYEFPKLPLDTNKSETTESNVLKASDLLTDGFDWSSTVGRDLGMSWTLLAELSSHMEGMFARADQTYNMILDGMSDTSLNGPELASLADTLRRA